MTVDGFSPVTHEVDTSIDRDDGAITDDPAGLVHRHDLAPNQQFAAHTAEDATPAN